MGLLEIVHFHFKKTICRRSWFNHSQFSILNSRSSIAFHFGPWTLDLGLCFSRWTLNIERWTSSPIYSPVIPCYLHDPWEFTLFSWAYAPSFSYRYPFSYLPLPPFCLPSWEGTKDTSTALLPGDGRPQWSGLRRPRWRWRERRISHHQKTHIQIAHTQTALS